MEPDNRGLSRRDFLTFKRSRESSTDEPAPMATDTAHTDLAASNQVTEGSTIIPADNPFNFETQTLIPLPKVITPTPESSTENPNAVGKSVLGRLVPWWVKSVLYGVGVAAVLPESAWQKRINRRQALFTGALALLGLTAAGCADSTALGGGEGALKIEGAVNIDDVDIDGLALLEKEVWDPDDWERYMRFAGFGGVMSYGIADAVLTTDPSRDVLRFLVAAANKRENLNYRTALLDLFDPKNNTMPGANGSYLNPQLVAKPNQFRSLGFTNPDGTMPQSWAEAKFPKATIGEMTVPGFGGRTHEYIPTNELLEGIDITRSDVKVTFLGETRNAKNVALRITDTVTGQASDVLAPRNVVFPNFNRDRGYRVITQEGVERIFTHLEARHPINNGDVRNLMQGIGNTTNVDYIIRGAGDRPVTQIGVRSLHDNKVHDVIFKNDATTAQLMAEGRVQDLIEHARNLPDDRVITAYDTFDSVNGGLKDDALVLHRRYRNLVSIQDPAIVYETLPNGEFLRLPESGSLMTRMASRLNRYTRTNTTTGQRIGDMLETLSRTRPKLKLAASIVGAALQVIAMETAKVAVDVYEAGTLYDQIREFAAQNSIYGYGEGPIAQSLDKYRQGFSIPIDIATTFTDSTGQLATKRAAKLPPLLGLPTAESERVSGLTFHYIKPTDEIPADAPMNLSVLRTQVDLNKTRMAVANNPFNRGIESLNFMVARDNYWNDPFTLGFPAIPKAFGELPEHLGVFLDETGQVNLCTIDYASDSGLGARLGTSISMIVPVEQIRDVVAHYGSYEATLAQVTPDSIATRSANYLVKYSIINNKQVSIEVTPA